MSAPAIRIPSKPATSPLQKMLNVLVAPSEVFDEVLASPVMLANWRIPTLLVSLAGLFPLLASGTEKQLASSLLTSVSPAQMPQLSLAWPLVAGLVAIASSFVGSSIAAVLLWGMARLFLRAHVSFAKSLEIIGLSQVLLFLGATITALLVGATGDPSARPALSLLALKLPPDRVARQVLDLFNIFYFWSATILSIGLSRLAAVSFKEAAFWVFGYWILARVALVLLA